MINRVEPAALPFREESEKGLLCSLLLAPGEVMKLCARRITFHAFYVPAHVILYEAILQWPKPGLPVDFTWLVELLKTDGQLEEVGGRETIEALLHFVPTHANANFYIDLLLEAQRRRELMLECVRVDLACQDPQEDSQGILKGALLRMADISHSTNGAERKVFIQAHKPSQIKAYEPPPGIVLVGDNHVVRGSVTIVGGPPGVGKSRTTVALAEAGATGLDWFGLPVHIKFKTLIVQNENGRFRLKQEFSELNCDILDQYVRITDPPPFGMCFARTEFQDQLRELIEDFKPDVIVIDPWNSVARDDRAKDYLETFNSIRAVIPAGETGPAIVIVAHTRKPQVGERASGRGLLNLLAGSYVLASIPRTVFIIQSASDAVDEERVVWTCCKNNDGLLGDRTAWTRQNGLFSSIHDFDWSGWDSDGKSDGPSYKIVAEIVAENSPENGEKSDNKITKQFLVQKLIEKGVLQRTAYDWITKAENASQIKFHKGVAQIPHE